jgi:hypothetical protein
MNWLRIGWKLYFTLYRDRIKARMTCKIRVRVSQYALRSERAQKIRTFNLVRSVGDKSKYFVNANYSMYTAPCTGRSLVPTAVLHHGFYQAIWIVYDRPGGFADVLPDFTAYLRLLDTCLLTTGFYACLFSAGLYFNGECWRICLTK